MNFGERSEIRSGEKITRFLHEERSSRIETIDRNGFPSVAPMNPVYFNSAIDVHGFPRGEKYENIGANSRCRFEVDRQRAFSFRPTFSIRPPTRPRQIPCTSARW